MRKKILPALFVLIYSGAYAADKSVIIEIRNVLVSSGRIFIAIYDSESAYKNGNPFRSHILDSTDAILRLPERLPEGEYVVSVFQDLNDNAKLDTNFIGIPKEPIGMTNYHGKGIPGGFDKLKSKVYEDRQIMIVNMIQM